MTAQGDHREELNTSLADLIAREEIADVVRGYAVGIDSRDVVAVLSCFTDDATLNYFAGDVVVRGTAEITEFFSFDRPNPVLERTEGSTHTSEITSLNLAGDTATASVACVSHLVGRKNGARILAIRGIRYDDEFIKTADGWKIRYRRHTLLWEALLPTTSE
jgi:ketosteroid isomerase-like protein